MSTDTVQVMLRDDRNGRMTVRVPAKPHAKVGDFITLPGSEHPAKWWLVVWRGEPMPAGAIKRGWHNDI